MALMALASGDAPLARRLRGLVDPAWHDFLTTPCWEAVTRQVRERPVSLLVLDLAVLPDDGAVAVVGLRRDFPGLPLLVLARPGVPELLFELGRARVSHLTLLPVEGTDAELSRAISRVGEQSAPGLVQRFVGALLPREATGILRASLELTHRCLPADDFARALGTNRPALSARLKEMGLPSVGQLQLWARLLHAGHWLPDPGRSGESVSRQLEYANGAVFRRTLRTFVGATPSEIMDGGGLSLVLTAFARRQALPTDRDSSMSVA